MKNFKLFYLMLGIMVVLSACGEQSNNALVPEAATSNIAPIAGVPSLEASSSLEASNLETPNLEASTITKAVYDKIQYGMTYEQVSEIAGPGKLVSGSANKSDGTAIYVYKGESDEVGANAVLSFTDNKLKQKVQIGLK